MRSNHLFDKIPKGIDAIIFCEFDVHLGPVLKHQVRCNICLSHLYFDDDDDDYDNFIFRMQ